MTTITPGNYDPQSLRRAFSSDSPRTIGFVTLSETHPSYDRKKGPKALRAFVSVTLPCLAEVTVCTVNSPDVLADDSRVTSIVAQGLKLMGDTRQGDRIAVLSGFTNVESGNGVVTVELPEAG